MIQEVPMSRFKRAAMALVLGVLAGCATTEDVLDDKERMLSGKEEDNAAMQRQLTDQQANESILTKQLDAEREKVRDLEARNQKLQEERDAMAKELSGVRSASKTDINVNDPDIEVVQRPNGDVVLRIPDRVTFDSGKASLTSGGKKVLGKIAAILNRHPEEKISIEGHTDDTPVLKSKGTWENNLTLSVARALAVRSYLVGNGKISEGRCRVVGWGEHNPAFAGKSKDIRSKNRRVEIVLYRGD
jgi:chemotaxis protein MotB